MIRRLYIKNLAVISRVDAGFKPGLNIITGETGSGKSILIEALNLCLGKRASADIVRTGEEVTVLECEIIDKQGSPQIIRRVIRLNGSSRAFLNDEPVKLLDLEEFTQPLVDLHGQHQHQSLLHVSTHLDFLDAFAGLWKKRGELRRQYHELQTASRELDRLSTLQQKESDRVELMRFQLNELDIADLDSDAEDQLLSEEHMRLSKAEDLRRILDGIERQLNSGSDSVTRLLTSTYRQIEKFTELGAVLEEFAERIKSLQIEAEELGFDIAKYKSGVKLDPQRLIDVEGRLSHLEVIKRKYGGTLKNAIAQMEKLRQEVEQVAEWRHRIELLKAEVAQHQQKYSDLCIYLSRKRREHKSSLETQIVACLRELDMPGARFEVNLNQTVAEGGMCIMDGITYQSDERGSEQVEFYLSTNPGEELRPLAKIASGGEISRIMLGIKTVLRPFDQVPTLIFDEIDTGISGATAETVGNALKELARERQVICITHLPQIAAMGDHHIVVRKKIHQGRTRSFLAEVDGEERVRELARLLSGIDITDASMEQAGELLRS